MKRNVVDGLVILHETPFESYHKYEINYTIDGEQCGSRMIGSGEVVGDDEDFEFSKISW